MEDQVLSNDNIMNGDPIAALSNGNIQAVPVHPGVVQALSDALDRARRGEIHAITIVGVRGSDLASFDSVVVDNMALAMIMIGASEVAKSKITQGAREAQQAAPASKIVRAPAGMRVG